MLNKLQNVGHELSASAQSVLYVRDAKIAKMRILATGTMLGTVFLLCTAGVAEANADLKSYSTTVSGNTNVIPDIIAYIAYLGGAALAALGIVDLKKHVENPSQTPMKNGLAKLGFGGMLLALPTITDVMQGTTGKEGGAGAEFDQFTRNPTI